MKRDLRLLSAIFSFVDYHFNQITIECLDYRYVMCSICHSDNNIVISVNTCKLLVFIPNKNETRTTLIFFFYSYVEMIVPNKNETRTALKKFFF